jgi:hypothetical protein
MKEINKKLLSLDEIADKIWDEFGADSLPYDEIDTSKIEYSDEVTVFTYNKFENKIMPKNI